MDLENNNLSLREEFIARNKPEWKVVGAKLKATREQLDISRNQLAININVSSSRVRNLEEGEPVRDAKLLTAAYKNFVKLKTYEGAIKYNALLFMEI